MLHICLFRMGTQTHTRQPYTQLNVPVTARKDFNPQPKLVPNYTAWWQKQLGVNNLPRVIT